MRLLYATSIDYPSKLANRLQIMAMARGFAKKLGDNFFIGGKRIQKAGQIQVINFYHTKSWKLSWQYLGVIKKNKINYVYCREARLLFLIIFLNKFFFRQKFKTIYEIHAIHKSFFDRLEDIILARQVDHFIFITKYLQDLFLKAYGGNAGKCLVLPDGVDLKIFDTDISRQLARQKLDLPQDKILIGYMGRFRTLDMEKGLDDILKSLTKLDDKVVFLAVGSKSGDDEYYQEQARKLNVLDRFIIIQTVDQKTLAVYQKACDALLMPFPNKEHYAYYMSPMKMFEYMASQRPIIATDLPSVREVLSENNAILVKPDDSEDLAKGIEKILKDQELSRKLASQAYLDVKKYTWEKRVGGIVEFIK